MYCQNKRCAFNNFQFMRAPFFGQIRKRLGLQLFARKTRDRDEMCVRSGLYFLWLKLLSIYERVNRVNYVRNYKSPPVYRNMIWSTRTNDYTFLPIRPSTKGKNVLLRSPSRSIFKKGGVYISFYYIIIAKGSGPDLICPFANIFNLFLSNSLAKLINHENLLLL